MDEERLIELVRENPLLYNLNNTDYIRTKLKDEVWNKIGAELGLNGKTVKEQWRKLRERHREALRRQKTEKSGSKAETPKPWTYQQHMEFLLPYMKNRNTSTNVEEQPPAEINAPDDEETETERYIQEEPEIENSNEPERSQPANSDTPTVKRPKLSDQTVIRRFIETAQMRSKNRDDLRKEILQRDQSQSLNNDALYQFFLSMYYTTKGLPGKYQRQIRNKLYEAVSQAEDENDFVASTSPPLSIPERFASSSSSLTGQNPNNIINKAFSQAVEQNDFEASTTPPLSPSYSEGSLTPGSSTVLEIQPPLTVWPMVVDEDAQGAFPTSRKYISL